MFRQRLSFALGILALAFMLQGAVAWWAIDVATGHVQRGRVASDLLKAYLELSATKQRLRSWTAQALLQAGADGQLRDRYQLDMLVTLQRLEPMRSALPSWMMTRNVLIRLWRSAKKRCPFCVVPSKICARL